MPITAKISKPAHLTLKLIAEKTGKPMQLVLDEAVELYRREKFFEALNLEVLALKAKPQEWNEELEERKVLEGTLLDGLDDET
jgi:hypothetical protein